MIILSTSQMQALPAVLAQLDDLPGNHRLDVLFAAIEHLVKENER